MSGTLRAPTAGVNLSPMGGHYSDGVNPISCHQVSRHWCKAKQNRSQRTDCGHKVGDCTLQSCEAGCSAHIPVDYSWKSLIVSSIMSWLSPIYRRVTDGAEWLNNSCRIATSLNC